ncbi:MAG: hypothetical protein ACLR3C_13610 [Eggerthella lenta]
MRERTSSDTFEACSARIWSSLARLALASASSASAWEPPMIPSARPSTSARVRSATRRSSAPWTTASASASMSRLSTATA